MVKLLAEESQASELIDVSTPKLFAGYASQGRWVSAPHLDLLDRELTSLIYGDMYDGMIVEMPPRHGKSEICSKYTPSWYLGKFPRNRVILTSYEAGIASGFGRRCRDLLIEHGPKCFGVEVRPDIRAVNNWELATEGGMNTAGVGGALTGKGADLLIIDDPIKNAEQAMSPMYRQKCWDFWDSTAKTRIHPGGKVLLIMTRWHKDDLVGRLLAKSEAEEKGFRWKRLTLPALAKENDPLGRQPGEALWPERYPKEQLERMKASSSAYWWGALYDQDPRELEGAEWPDTYFEGAWFDEWPEANVTELRLMACDPSKGKDAKKGDYTAIVIGYVSSKVLYVDAVIERMTTATIADRMVRLAKQHHVHAASIEANGFQELLAGPIQAQAQAHGVSFPLTQFVNTTNKVVRIRGLSSLLANRRVRFKRNSVGAEMLVRQLQGFPLEAHDDGPDALEMLFRLWMRATGQKPPSNVPDRIAVPGGW